MDSWVIYILRATIMWILGIGLLCLFVFGLQHFIWITSGILFLVVVLITASSLRENAIGCTPMIDIKDKERIEKSE